MWHVRGLCGEGWGRGNHFLSHQHLCQDWCLGPGTMASRWMCRKNEPTAPGLPRPPPNPGLGPPLSRGLGRAWAWWRCPGWGPHRWRHVTWGVGVQHLQKRPKLMLGDLRLSGLGTTCSMLSLAMPAAQDAKDSRPVTRAGPLISSVGTGGSQNVSLGMGSFLQTETQTEAGPKA